MSKESKVKLTGQDYKEFLDFLIEGTKNHKGETSSEECSKALAHYIEGAKLLERSIQLGDAKGIKALLEGSLSDLLFYIISGKKISEKTQKPLKIHARYFSDSDELNSFNQGG